TVDRRGYVWSPAVRVHQYTQKGHVRVALFLFLISRIFTVITCEKMSNALEICSNCGKGEEESCNLKACGACFLVKYCSRNCQAAHRAQHKKACKKRAAELFHDKLFQVPPPRNECPICMIPLPVDKDNGQQEIFKSCCGNFICNGCCYVMTTKAQDEGKSFEETLCAYCRTREYRGDKEFIERLEDHMERGNGDAHMALGAIYLQGIHGLPQDVTKSNELFLKAGELGCSGGYYNLAKAYELGRGVDINKKKARHFYELAAIMGNVLARCMLAGYESESGNVPLAFKHFSISASRYGIDGYATPFEEGRRVDRPCYGRRI
ncbi:hypothetical protein ACHAWC_004829, partial [Mediolabrus comicus]